MPGWWWDEGGCGAWLRGFAVGWARGGRHTRAGTGPRQRRGRPGASSVRRPSRLLQQRQLQAAPAHLVFVEAHNVADFLTHQAKCNGHAALPATHDQHLRGRRRNIRSGGQHISIACLYSGSRLQAATDIACTQRQRAAHVVKVGRAGCGSTGDHPLPARPRQHLKLVFYLKSSDSIRGWGRGAAVRAGPGEGVRDGVRPAGAAAPAPDGGKGGAEPPSAQRAMHRLPARCAPPGRPRGS